MKTIKDYNAQGMIEDEKYIVEQAVLIYQEQFRQ